MTTDERARFIQHRKGSYTRWIWDGQIWTPVQEDPQPDWTPGKPKQKEPKPERPTCRICDRELSATLDAYYGKDAMAASLCSKCRRVANVG